VKDWIKRHKFVGLFLAMGLALLWLLPPCLFERIFSVPCLTCGMSRSFFALLRLDFKQSFLLHPMTLFVPVFVMLMVHRNRFNKNHRRVADVVMIAIIIALVVVYIVRLINGSLFELM
jgi:hypothetical protein